MPSLPFLDLTTEIYEKHKLAWAREERRLYGGDAVINETELLKWKAEEAGFYASRLGQAGYITLPSLHTSTLTGHLSAATPMPNFAELGNVRQRDDVDQKNPSKAELLNYNVGIGNDGQELIPWFDGVQEWAIATGFRWILVEMPTMGDLANIRLMNRRPVDAAFSNQDVIDGFRPYPVEYSPLDVPFWQYTNGRLDCAIIRIPIIPTDLINLPGTFGGNGYYLLVRRGFTGFGGDYAQGGWWKFDPDQEPIGQGTWEATGGQIPFFPFIGMPSKGTTELPAIARSLTMELGQIAVSLMNRISERNWNMMQAAKSENWIMGIEPDKHASVVRQQDLGSITIGVPPVMLGDGRSAIPTMWNSSSALLDASAFEMVIKSGLEEAREIMIKQITSAPDSSGLSKQVGFAEASSPLLVRLAATRQQAINNFLYFAALRFGIPSPNANVQIPREFRLEPLVQSIDDGLAVLKRSWLRSPTLEKRLVIQSMDERGLMPDDKAERQKIEDELDASGQEPTQPVDPLADDSLDTPSRQAIKPATPASNGAAA